MTPRARGSKMGVRSPAKYGRRSRPPEPGGTAAASWTRSANGTSPTRPCTHEVRLPDVDIPAASVYVPGSTPAVVHSSGCEASWLSTWTKNIVEPYISMRSPGLRTPALNASAHASTVPVHTGVPSGSCVTSAAFAVMRPTTSLGQARRGAARPSITSAYQGWYQPLARMSYSGSH